MLHTSKAGTGSSKLLSTLTDRFIAEANSWEAKTSSNPALSSRNDDREECRDPEKVGWWACMCMGLNTGGVSSGISGPSSLEGRSELGGYTIAEARKGRADSFVITEGCRELMHAERLVKSS